MRINRITVQNFRNYENLELNFDNSRNIIIGENAQGKTNLIEAIYLCAFARSFRTNNSTELVRFEHDLARINADITSEDIDKNINIAINKQGKKMITKDSKLVRRTADLLNNLVVIIFSPEDLRIIKDSPEKRRTFINREISQLRPKYYDHLKKYNEALRQKNALLKQIINNPKFNDTILDIYDEQLAIHGIEIIKYRRDFITKLSETAGRIQSAISAGKENLSISIEETLSANTKSELLNCIKHERDHDIYYGSAASGPHRDDLVFAINRKDARKYGSQGQQRTIALSLKLAEIEIAKEILGENPILLLDDVLSELDIERQSYLINEIKDVQLFITTTELNDNISNNMKDASIYRIKAGNII